MKKWEYSKIALNEPPRGRDDVYLLCDAGEEGWELISVLPTGIAYLKREIMEDVVTAAEEPAVRDEPVAEGHEVKAKYRDPLSGETWSGRGRMASWLKRKVDAGEDIANYLA